MEASEQHASSSGAVRERRRAEPLAALVRREPLRAWAETTTDLPWGDPAFSERMLAEHLDQTHDLALRRLAVVEQQVEWLVERLGFGRRSGARPRLWTGPLRGGARTPRRRRDRRRRGAGRRAGGPHALRRPPLVVRLLRHAHDRARGALLRCRDDPLRTAGRAAAGRGRGAAPQDRGCAQGGGPARRRGGGRDDVLPRDHLDVVDEWRTTCGARASISSCTSTAGTTTPRRWSTATTSSTPRPAGPRSSA